MSYKIPAPDSASRGRGTGKGYPHPRPSQGRHGTLMRSAQRVYPICADEATVVAFVEFEHTHGSSLLQTARGARAPRVCVSLIEGLRCHILRTGSAIEIFRPDNQTSQLVEHGQTLISSIHDQVLKGPLPHRLYREPGNYPASGLSWKVPLARRPRTDYH